MHGSGPTAALHRRGARGGAGGAGHEGRQWWKKGEGKGEEEEARRGERAVRQSLSIQIEF